MLNVSDRQVCNLVAAGMPLAVDGPHGERRPDWQFDLDTSGVRRQGIAPVAAVFPGRALSPSAWMVAPTRRWQAAPPQPHLLTATSASSPLSQSTADPAVTARRRPRKPATAAPRRGGSVARLASRLLRRDRNDFRNNGPRARLDPHPRGLPVDHPAGPATWHGSLLFDTDVRETLARGTRNVNICPAWRGSLVNMTTPSLYGLTDPAASTALEANPARGETLLDDTSFERTQLWARHLQRASDCLRYHAVRHRKTMVTGAASTMACGSQSRPARSSPSTHWSTAPCGRTPPPRVPPPAPLQPGQRLPDVPGIDLSILSCWSRSQPVTSHPELGRREAPRDLEVSDLGAFLVHVRVFAGDGHAFAFRPALRTLRTSGVWGADLADLASPRPGASRDTKWSLFPTASHRARGSEAGWGMRTLARRTAANRPRTRPEPLQANVPHSLRSAPGPASAAGD